MFLLVISDAYLTVKCVVLKILQELCQTMEFAAPLIQSTWETPSKPKYQVKILCVATEA